MERIKLTMEDIRKNVQMCKDQVWLNRKESDTGSMYSFGRRQRTYMRETCATPKYWTPRSIAKWLSEKIDDDAAVTIELTYAELELFDGRLQAYLAIPDDDRHHHELQSRSPKQLVENFVEGFRYGLRTHFHKTNYRRQNIAYTFKTRIDKSYDEGLRFVVELKRSNAAVSTAVGNVSIDYTGRLIYSAEATISSKYDLTDPRSKDCVISVRCRFIEVSGGGSRKNTLTYILDREDLTLKTKKGKSCGAVNEQEVVDGVLRKLGVVVD